MRLDAVSKLHFDVLPVTVVAGHHERIDAEPTRLHEHRGLVLRQQFANLGVEALSTTPSEFAAVIKADIEKWGNIIRAAKITVN